MRKYLLGITAALGVAGVSFLPVFVETPEQLGDKANELRDRYLCDAPQGACVSAYNDGGTVPVPYVNDLFTYQSRNYLESFVAVSHDGGCIVHIVQRDSQHEAAKGLDAGIFSEDSCYTTEKNLPINAIYGRILNYPGDSGVPDFVFPSDGGMW